MKLKTVALNVVPVRISVAPSTRSAAKARMTALPPARARIPRTTAARPARACMPAVPSAISFDKISLADVEDISAVVSEARLSWCRLDTELLLSMSAVD